MNRHAHHVRRNGLTLEITKAIEAFANRTPELTEGEIQITLLEMLFQRAERQSLAELALSRVIDTALNLAHQHDSRQAASDFDDAVDEYLKW